MTAATLPRLSANDRLGVSLVGSALVHVVQILGVGFVYPRLRDLDALPTLEITLVQTATERAPRQPDFLAQASQDGGGLSERADIARNPLPVPEIGERRHDALSVLALPRPPAPGAREKTRPMSEPDARTLPVPPPEPQRRDPPLTPPAHGLIEQAALEHERARLNAEISRSWQELQKRPRRKYLNASTQEYKFAAYMEAWRAKVERIGNLNYPEEAKRRRLTGSLVLDVAIRPDGSVQEVGVRRSSGHKLLDDAAVRIVELAAPFAPFPPDIRAETDLLHITRTWKFNETLSAD